MKTARPKMSLKKKYKKFKLQKILHEILLVVVA